MSKLYIAYGSNLNKEQMKHRCPDAKLIGTGKIENYELLFRGGKAAVATIEPHTGESVLFGLWQISEQDELKLDRYEGFPNLYYKKEFTLRIKEKETKAMAYIMDPRYEIGIPTDYYYRTIQQGYMDCGLDVQKLEEAVQKSTDTFYMQQEQKAMQMRFE